MKDKVTCTFANLTPAQAISLAEWYSHSGEQDADVWFEVNCEDPSPWTSDKPNEIDEAGNVTVFCQTFN